MEDGSPNILSRLDRFGRHAENALLVALLALMIVLGALQIIQRNIFDTSFIWSDELLRLLVLWLGLAGAVAASREDRHINIDILSRFLSERQNLYLRILLDVFTVAVCLLLAWSGARFVQMEHAFASTVLTGLPAWPFEAIIPIAFTLIAWRYALFVARRVIIIKQTRGAS